MRIKGDRARGVVVSVRQSADACELREPRRFCPYTHSAPFCRSLPSMLRARSVPCCSMQAAAATLRVAMHAAVLALLRRNDVSATHTHPHSQRHLSTPCSPPSLSSPAAPAAVPSHSSSAAALDPYSPFAHSIISHTVTTRAADLTSADRPSRPRLFPCLPPFACTHSRWPPPPATPISLFLSSRRRTVRRRATSTSRPRPTHSPTRRPPPPRPPPIPSPSTTRRRTRWPCTTRRRARQGRCGPQMATSETALSDGSIIASVLE